MTKNKEKTSKLCGVVHPDSYSDDDTCAREKGHESYDEEHWNHATWSNGNLRWSTPQRKRKK